MHGIQTTTGQILRNEIFGYGGDGIRLDCGYGRVNPDVLLYNNVHDNTGEAVDLYDPTSGLQWKSQCLSDNRLHWNPLQSSGAVVVDKADAYQD